MKLKLDVMNIENDQDLKICIVKKKGGLRVLKRVESSSFGFQKFW